MVGISMQVGRDRERQENRKTKTMRKIKTRPGWTQHAGGQRQRENDKE